jgi:hypothetical protein
MKTDKWMQIVDFFINTLIFKAKMQKGGVLSRLLNLPDSRLQSADCRMKNSAI